MREKTSKIGESVFSLFIILSLLGGAVVFFSFVISIIIGGEAGQNLAVMTKSEIMPVFIIFATIAMAGGLIQSYSDDEHSLTLKD